MGRPERGSFVFFRSDRHQIGQCGVAICGSEARFQNVCILDVAAFSLISASRSDAPEASPLEIEQCGKDGWTIEARPTQPIERTAPGDQRRRAAIADDSVV